MNCPIVAFPVQNTYFAFSYCYMYCYICQILSKQKLTRFTVAFISVFCCILATRLGVCCVTWFKCTRTLHLTVVTWNIYRIKFPGKRFGWEEPIYYENDRKNVHVMPTSLTILKYTRFLLACHKYACSKAPADFFQLNPFMSSRLFFTTILWTFLFPMTGCLVSFLLLLCFREIPVHVFNAKSVDPDQMLHSVAFDLDLHSLQITLLRSPD